MHIFWIPCINFFGIKTNVRCWQDSLVWTAHSIRYDKTWTTYFSGLREFRHYSKNGTDLIHGLLQTVENDQKVSCLTNFLWLQRCRLFTKVVGQSSHCSLVGTQSFLGFGGILCFFIFSKSLRFKWWEKLTKINIRVVALENAMKFEKKNKQ